MKRIALYLLASIILSSCEVGILGDASNPRKYGIYDKDSYFKTPRLYIDKNESSTFINSHNLKKIHAKQNKGCLVTYKEFDSYRYKHNKMSLYSGISTFTLGIIPYYNKRTVNFEFSIVNLSNQKVLKKFLVKENVHILYSLLFNIIAAPVEIVKGDVFSVNKNFSMALFKAKKTGYLLAGIYAKDFVECGGSI